jgi:hypothetical protein
VEATVALVVAQVTGSAHVAEYPAVICAWSIVIVVPADGM